MNIEALREKINVALTEQVAKNARMLREIDPQLNPVAEALTEYLSDGKRFRPIFALLGYLGTGGKLSEPIIRAATSLEFLQASALIHDDLIDGSDTRRGRAAIHRKFAQLNGKPSGDQFGAAAAILIGDLAMVWNEQALHESGISLNSTESVNPIHDVMRNELMAGQFLDIFEQTQSSHSIERSLKIARYKSGKYSIERPLHFGAALSNPVKLTEYFSIYSEYGLPLGEAFQLRDDLLGIFGDPAITGKPAGDDLREGKRTALIAFTYERGSQATKKLLDQYLGTDIDNDELATLRSAIEESGAATHVEGLIEKLSEQALDAIQRDEIDSLAKSLLIEMVSQVTQRNR